MMVGFESHGYQHVKGIFTVAMFLIIQPLYLQTYFKLFILENRNLY